MQMKFLKPGLLAILCIVITFFNLSAQNMTTGVPEILRSKLFNSLLITELPGLDSIVKLKSALLFDNDNSKAGPVAYNFKVGYTPANSGKWEKYTSGINTWVLRLRSKNAKAISLVLSDVRLKQGEKIYILNATEVLSVVSASNTSKSGIIPFNFLEGDEIAIEFDSPYNASNRGTLKVEMVSHAYKNITTEPGSCNIDISCPEGNNYQDIKRSVVKMVIHKTSGTWLCTGSLVNNTSQDFKPYILTAEHCVNSQYDADRTIFTFDYESPYCNGPKGIQDKVFNGCIYRASAYEYDFSILELNDHPPLSYRPYYAGWDISDNTINGGVSIHHPWGAPKKISVDSGFLSISTFVEAGEPPRAQNAFWLVSKWNSGVTEKGSSGGPLFNTNKKIIGTLTGGQAACGSPYNDFYERLSKAWLAETYQNRQAKAWLDPLNLNIEVMAGVDPFEGINPDCDTLSNIGEEEISQLFQYTPGIGYYSGTNSDSISLYAEKFVNSENAMISGVIMNIGKYVSPNQSGMIVSIYKGNDIPEEKLAETYVSASRLQSSNPLYVDFFPYVSVTTNYFIAYSIPYSQGDTLAINQAYWRTGQGKNTAYIMYNNVFQPLSDYSPNGYGTSFDVKPVKCTNIPDGISSAKLKILNVLPNPVTDKLIIKLPFVTKYRCFIQLSNLSGSVLNIPFVSKDGNIECNVRSLKPGIYFIKVIIGSEIYSAKFLKTN